MIRLGFLIIAAVQTSFHPAKARGYDPFPRHSFSSTYSQYLQPDDVDSGKYDSPYQVSSKLCVRSCESSAPKTCYFRFTLEAYSTLNQACGNCTSKGHCTTPTNPQCILGDGYERPVLVVNRRMAGPSIQVCKGDTIVVDVANMMPGRTTTIHWHGLTQKLTPYMDGVPMVTQCPIPEATIFRYKFLAETGGTYFWHAHDGFQKMDGVIGSLIIRQPRSLDPNNQYYDADLPSHVVLVTDWFHNTTSDSRWPGLRLHDSAQLPDTFLLNGKGRAQGFQAPLAEFVVKPNSRYRFRFIGGTCLVCPFQVSVEGHSLTLISMDKSAVEPITVDSFAALPGERYDFVIETSKSVSSYWIHVKGIGPCESTTKAYQLGVLRYEGSRHPRPPGRPPGYEGYRYTRIFNFPNADCNPTNRSIVCISHLNNKETINPILLTNKPDVRILLTPGFRNYKLTELFQLGKYSRHFVPLPSAPPLAATINNISNVLPSSPLLSQYRDIPKDEFCSDECLSNNSPTLCHCLDLIPVPKNQLIELVIADSGGIGLTHPMHLHGYCYYVMAQGVFPAKLSFDESVQFLNQELNSGLHVRPFPPMKDSVPLPSKGYFVLRIYSDNPGFWFFHCHFLYHHQTGMSAVLQVGELSDMVSPPFDFPKCGNFLGNEFHKTGGRR